MKKERFLRLIKEIFANVKVKATGGYLFILTCLTGDNTRDDFGKNTQFHFIKF